MDNFTFRTTLSVLLQGGMIDTIMRDIAVEGYDAEDAQSHLRSVATELCHDQGSRWFDAPVEEVDIVTATLVRKD